MPVLEAEGAEGDPEYEPADAPPVLQPQPGHHKSADGTVWKEDPPVGQGGRRRAVNIFTGNPGLSAEARAAVSLLDCFELFLTQEICQTVIDWTNAFGVHVIQDWNNANPFAQQKIWPECDEVSYGG